MDSKARKNDSRIRYRNHTYLDGVSHLDSFSKKILNV